MVTIASNGTGGGVWSAGTSWNGGSAPTSTQDVSIVNGDTITIDGSVECGSDTTTPAIDILAGGILDWPSTVAADYTLTVNGDIHVHGTFNIGSVANPIPSTRTATVLLNKSAAGADVKYGLLIQAGGTFVCQGAADRITLDRTHLAADAAANATSLTVADSLDWVDNDVIAIASTSVTPGESEKGAINGDGAGTGITVDGFTGTGGGLKYEHSGTTNYQAEIVNLTRNVVITAQTPANVSYVVFETTAAVNVDWTEFSYLGDTPTDKQGIVIKTAVSGSCDLNRCAFHDFEDCGIYASGNGHNNWNLRDSVAYKIASNGSYNSVQAPATSGTAWSIDGLWVIGGAGRGIQSQDVGGTITDCVVAGSSQLGLYLYGTGDSGGTLGNLLVHSCGGNGISIGSTNATIATMTVWRCGGYGLSLDNSTDLLITDLTLESNGGANLNVPYGAGTARILRGAIGSSDIYTTSYGLQITSLGGHGPLTLQGVVFGSPVAHSSGDIHFQNAGAYADIRLQGCTLNSSSVVTAASFANMTADSLVTSQRDGNVAGVHRTWKKYGAIALDSSTFDVTPSAKLTPTNATGKLECPVGQVCVNSGETAGVSVKVRLSSSGDGFEYLGSAPRLIAKANYAAGQGTDTVLATASHDTHGEWQTLTGTTPAVDDDAVFDLVVDCDAANSNSGWINVDTASVT